MLREIRCLSFSVSGPLLPARPRVIMLATFLVRGIDAPPAYCPISSILLNMNLGKGITTVNPLRVIKLEKLRKVSISGCFAYVTSSALLTDFSTKLLKLGASLGLTEDASFIKSFSLPSFSVSIKSILYSLRTRRSSSPKN